MLVKWRGVGCRFVKKKKWLAIDYRVRNEKKKIFANQMSARNADLKL